MQKTKTTLHQGGFFYVPILPNINATGHITEGCQNAESKEKLPL